MASTSSKIWVVRLRLPVVLVTLAGTAIPVALRPLQPLDLGLLGHDPSDILQNVAGFVPVGIALAALSPVRAVLIAAALSLVAECSQLFMLYRWPAFADVLANVLGGILGVTVARCLDFSASVRATRKVGFAAGVMALLILSGAWALKISSNLFTGRPATTTGRGGLEAHWTFDAVSSGTVADYSGHGLDGTLHGRPQPVTGPVGTALKYDGSADYADFGQPPDLRLSSSLTISAWTNSASFPRDDAAIVSSHDDELGYQLDTTIDSGKRTVGFKLASACGTIMARYGATSLKPDTWYYATGVYNAADSTINVYLDGKLDNGLLIGPVMGAQLPSRANNYIGRRSEDGYGFAGAIGDVRIYSQPLTEADIIADMRASPPRFVAPANDGPPHPVRPYAECSQIPDRDDARFPGAAALLGVLAAIAAAGLARSNGLLLCLAASLFAGLSILPVTPSLGAGCVMAVLCLLGGSSVALTMRRDGDAER